MGHVASTYERAVRLLTGRDHGTAELRKKLLDRGCPGAEVDDAVERLTRAGYLDDAALVVREVDRLVARGAGPAAVQQKLRGRGFAAEDVAHALAPLREAGDVEAACRRALERRFGPPDPTWDRAQRMRVARFLAGRGFSGEMVRAALAGVPDEADE